MLSLPLASVSASSEPERSRKKFEWSCSAPAGEPAPAASLSVIVGSILPLPHLVSATLALNSELRTSAWLPPPPPPAAPSAPSAPPPRKSPNADPRLEPRSSCLPHLDDAESISSSAAHMTRCADSTARADRNSAVMVLTLASISSLSSAREASSCGRSGVFAAATTSRSCPQRLSPTLTPSHLCLGSLGGLSAFIVVLPAMEDMPIEAYEKPSPMLGIPMLDMLVLTDEVALLTGGGTTIRGPSAESKSSIGVPWFRKSSHPRS
mmetsp:Transcript_4101/g.8751  ORF Transcript_4101/g.8751 Transcript_4101/m.8751 type:complete len:265 (-) Transcript_4101:692-1486(-)